MSQDLIAQLLLQELDILTPTLIVFQQADARPFFQPAARMRGWDHTPLPADNTGAAP